ncbi:MAG: V-type ATPase subunit [Clostridia bacterium]|nr:V-type ATPase subunit [Clostridia bacterium]
MAKDVVYTNGVIAAKEAQLLGGKILKLCEAGAEDAFRSLTENGFGKGADIKSFREYEKLIAADNADIDEFIRTYAPTDAEKSYFLAPRDFHNAKAAVKAQYAGGELQAMLAPDGLVPAEEIVRCVKENDYSALCSELKEACESAVKMFSDEEDIKTVSGAAVGLIFENAKYKYLLKACARNRFLKKLIISKIDMTNILTVFRSQTPEYALNNVIPGGKLKHGQLQALFSENTENAENSLNGTPYEEFLNLCFAAKNNSLPLTKAELMLDNAETDALEKKKYELKNKEPFLYYVLRRRAENANIRIIFVCLSAGMDEASVKSRLRAV